MRDLYKFYQNSHKRKEELSDVAIERTYGEKAIMALNTEMDKSIEKGINNLRFFSHDLLGKDLLSKIPSLRLKKWNATRWLGREPCVTALCNAYVYILDHLRKAKQDMSLKIEIREMVENLYNDLTTYEVIVFLHFYRDLTAFLGIISKQLQRHDVKISGVGRIIQTQLTRLRLYFPKDSTIFPSTPIGDGYGAKIVEELFKGELESIFILRRN